MSSTRLRSGVAAIALALLLGATVATSSSARAGKRAAADRAPDAFSFNSGGFGRAVAEGGDGANAVVPSVVKNMELISKYAPPSQGAIQPEQIADLAVFKQFAYLNSWSQEACDKGGTYIVDIRNAAAPKEVTFLPALANNYHGEGAQVATIDTPAYRGDVLAVNNETCGPAPRGGGFDLYDVSDPTKPQTLIQGFGDFGGEGSLVKGPGDDDKANEAHSIFIWDAGTKAYAVIVDNEEVTDVDIFDISNPRSPQPVREYDLAFETPAWTETANVDEPFLHDMVVKNIGGKNVMLASYWDAGYIQMDASDPANLVYMSDSDFGTVDPLTGFVPPEGNAHQAEYSHDNKYIVTGEEDFNAYRVVDITLAGLGNREATNVNGGAPPEALDDEVLNGPVVYGGYGCDASEAKPGHEIPDVDDVTLPPKAAGEEYIIALQRGPAFDPDEDYDGDGNIDNDDEDACFPGDKAANAIEKGWDAVLLVNRHPSTGDPADDAANCGSGNFPPGSLIVTVCTTHGAFHEMFDDPPAFGVPYDDSDGEPGDSPLPADGPNIGEVAEHKVSAEGTFDGWGYMSMYGTTPDGNGKLPLLDTYAIPEAMNPQYAVGFGDLSIHEQAADPTEPLSYSSYYAGGMRVFSFESGKITPQGAFVESTGSNFWGVEQYTTPEGDRIIAGSDRDRGLYLFRYTGPFSPKAPACSDAGAIVPYKGSVSVPLTCTDANGNPLTRSVTTQPGQGTLAAIDQGAGKVTYTHTGRSLGADSFAFQASDGAAGSRAATARLQVVPGNGGRCFNPFAGTARSESIAGSRFGDRIDGAGGRDVINGNGGADCVLGRAGNDGLRGGTGNDTVSGGSGRDRVRGDKGNDRLSGSSGKDRLEGGDGRDRLNGGGSADRLTGGSGVDRFTGGKGNDRILARDGRRERINCGGGKDRVQADRRDRVSRNCERVSRPKRKK